MDYKNLLANLPLALREKQIVKPHGFLPVSRAHWWRGVKDGRYPKPFVQTGRLTMWRTADVLALLEGDSAYGKNLQRAEPSQGEFPASHQASPTKTPQIKQKAITPLKEQARPPNLPFPKKSE